ncbi:thermonuclease family protein [Paracoccus albus]|uniref:thermonuclease family protein n=1 Tax=Paracoccus albus TaxID=3017784 RepID=UPI0022EFF909|nr:thermonuclease family protein [Paracoccus albus]WBU59827.1 thermonuclease family protein [Paracoccus albus]
MEIWFILLVLVAVCARALRGKRSPHKKVHSGSLPSFEKKSASPPPARTVIRGAAYVIDGDTVVIQRTQVRLFGIDAPELEHPYGRQAKWALVSLCKGKKVSAEIVAIDDHGRTVARCYLENGGDLSAEMVKLGLAIDWPKHSGGKYSSLEIPGVRKKLWLADARQKGRMHVWEQYEARKHAAAKLK